MEYAKRRKWYIQSVSDPRWNMTGEGVSTRFDTPMELNRAIEQLEIEFGEKPADLKIGYYQK
jgi:hypothetical protein